MTEISADLVFSPARFLEDNSTRENPELGEDNAEVEISLDILIILFMLMLAITAGHYLKKSGHQYLQEAGLSVIIGMVIGLIFKYIDIGVYVNDLSQQFNSIFMILLLPPIIFESGYNMKKQYFFKNVGTVMLFAFLGTFVAMFSSSMIFYFMGQTPYSYDFTLKESFAFGALISATDPVSVLAIFKEMNADMNLYTIVFGESIFNDAVAIVMYQTVISVGESDRSTGEEIGAAIGNFCLIFVGSLVMGAVSALLTAFILKRQKSVGRRDHEQTIYDPDTNININNANEEQPQIQMTEQERLREEEVLKQEVMTEVTMMMLGPWVSYLIAEGLELSGIVAILTYGVFLSYYARPNISDQSKKVVAMGYETIAYAFETTVFLFLGIGLFAIQHPFEKMGWGLFITTILNLNFTRFLNVGLCTFITNKFRTESKINKKTSFVIWFSGLRGAMAYALALSCAVDFPVAGPVILIDTLLYSFVTILIQGSAMNPILARCDVKQKPESEEQQNEQVRENCCNKFKERVRQFDTFFFAPLFIKTQSAIMERNQSQASAFEAPTVEEINRFQGINRGSFAPSNQGSFAPNNNRGSFSNANNRVSFVTDPNAEVHTVPDSDRGGVAEGEYDNDMRQ